jgi:hypothetical protein
MTLARIPFLLALTPLLAAQDAAEAKKPEPTFRLSQQDTADGWHVLFDGTSTEAWRGYRQAGFPATGWSIADGALHHAEGGGGGDLITRRTYRNFELEFEWKIAPGGNSGVMYRVIETEHPSYWTGPEYQVLDDAAHGADPVHRSGALYALYPATGAEVKPAGSWNQSRIAIAGDQVVHWLNGQKVVEARFGSEDWESKVAASKFATWDGFGQNARGHICLQDHGNAVWYRNLRCRELPPSPDRLGEPVALFDGSEASLARWSHHLQGSDAPMSAVWTVRDGVLVCAGKPAGYIHTKASFEDFVLKVVWRFDPAKGAGNSGVLLRTTGEHKVWPRSVEAQLQSGSAGDFWNIGEVPMQVDAGRTRGRNTRKTHGSEKPLGEWNEYEIVCDDGWISLRVNGEVLNEAWNCEDIAGLICLQSEGAEIHFREVTLIPLKN